MHNVTDHLRGLPNLYSPKIVVIETQPEIIIIETYIPQRKKKLPLCSLYHSAMDLCKLCLELPILCNVWWKIIWV